MLAEAAVGGERQQAITALRNVLSIDSIYVTSTDFRNRPRVAVLIPPTHPLRALWLCGWSALAEDWIEKIRAGGKEYIPLARSALLEGFMPSAYPVGIPVKGGRIFTPVDNLNAFWALYAPTAEKNSRSLLAEICSALGLPEPSAAGTDVSGKVIADKIERYISQHPYVRELSLNIFKPGAGSVIAEALQILQKKKEYAGLRYDIRLFTPDPDSPVLGEALEAMVRPEAMVGGSADAFATSRGNHLYSKLNLAKHTLEDFHDRAYKFPAHISILLDAFPAGELAIAKKEPGATPLHGLIQDFNTEFVDEESGFFWNRWPVVGHSISTTNKTPCFDLLSSLSKQLCFATSAVATAGTSFEATPVVTLGLDAKQRQLIFEVHQFSDWVFTIDRNMGIEYFDHGGHKDKPSYLIDFVPGASAQATHNLIISSRSTDELEAMLKPLMRAHGLTASGTQPAEILDNLRSLSGQLALKLISVSAQQSDALGLGLARMFLKLQGALSNQIIVPLDAHTDLYDAGGKSNEVNDAVSLQRTDLALFDLNLEARTITCSLVGVKCSPQGKPHDVLLQAKKSIMEQVQQSESTLKSHFDPNQKTPDRPDRLLKSRELARILRFYLERSVRYDIFAEAAAAEAHNLIKSIEQGYKLKFKQSALIFDFDHDGTELSDNEEGMQYHRIGKDIIHAMLDNC
ncbi:MAG: ATP-binding protein, partial [Proteobacteria bacterium]|nr:ATP-binding protein [Pseudomonadota bacterium]